MNKKGFFGAKHAYYDQAAFAQLRSECDELVEEVKGVKNKINVLERKDEIHDNALRDMLVTMHSYGIGMEIKEMGEINVAIDPQLDEEDEFLPSGVEDSADNDDTFFLDEDDSNGDVDEPDTDGLGQPEAVTVVDDIDDVECDGDDSPVGKVILKFEEMENDRISLEEKIARLEAEKQQLLTSNAALRHELSAAVDEKETAERELAFARDEAEKEKAVWEKESARLRVEKNEAENARNKAQRDLAKYEAERKKLEALLDRIS